MFQTNDQDRTSEKDFNEMEISNLLDKEFRGRVLKMLTNSGEEWKNIMRIQQRNRKLKKQQTEVAELRKTITD